MASVNASMVKEAAASSATLLQLLITSRMDSCIRSRTKVAAAPAGLLLLTLFSRELSPRKPTLLPSESPSNSSSIAYSSKTAAAQVAGWKPPGDSNLNRVTCTTLTTLTYLARLELKLSVLMTPARLKARQLATIELSMMLMR